MFKYKHRWARRWSASSRVTWPFIACVRAPIKILSTLLPMLNSSVQSVWRGYKNTSWFWAPSSQLNLSCRSVTLEEDLFGGQCELFWTLQLNLNYTYWSQFYIVFFTQNSDSWLWWEAAVKQAKIEAWQETSGGNQTRWCRSKLWFQHF